jgi:hypothetical protein
MGMGDAGGSLVPWFGKGSVGGFTEGIALHWD